MTGEKMSIFDLMYDTYKITKPIKVIELFAGYGSQTLALKYIGANYEHHRIVEWAIPSIIAYADVHQKELPNYGKDYTKEKTKEEIANELYSMGVSANYNNPATLDQLKRIQEPKLKLIYNSIKQANNLVDISRVKAEALDITSKQFTYLLTYSFPCQDLSLAGKRAGMQDQSTRSGLLWEVERILTECKQLEEEGKGYMPNVLLMENVIQVHSEQDKSHFIKWINRLEELGYQSYWEDLIATDYEIPQTRNRCFMVSIYGDYAFNFPKPKELKTRLKDLLEPEETIDEKYYLSEKMINYIYSDENAGKYNRKAARESCDRSIEKGIAATITTNAGSRPTDNFIKIKNNNAKGYLEAQDGDGVDISSRMEHHRGTVQNEKSQTITCAGGNDVGVVVKQNESKLIGGIGNKGSTNQYRTQNRIYSDNNSSPTINTCANPYIATKSELKKEMCEKLIAEGKIKENDVIRHSYTNSRISGEMKDQKTNNISPTLDTRCDCLGVATNELRIRKLTPRECLRLMGVRDDDIDRMEKHQTNALLYHLAGDSIVTNVLMAIFKELIE